MSTKEKLIERIAGINDEMILDHLMQMLDLELDLAKSEVRLSDGQKAFVEEGFKEYKSGKIIDDASAKRMTREWLSKK